MSLFSVRGWRVLRVQSSGVHNTLGPMLLRSWLGTPTRPQSCAWAVRSASAHSGWPLKFERELGITTRAPHSSRPSDVRTRRHLEPVLSICPPTRAHEPRARNPRLNDPGSCGARLGRPQQSHSRARRNVDSCPSPSSTPRSTTLQTFQTRHLHHPRPPTRLRSKSPGSVTDSWLR